MKTANRCEIRFKCKHSHHNKCSNFDGDRALCGDIMNAYGDNSCHSSRAQIDALKKELKRLEATK